MTSPLGSMPRARSAATVSSVWLRVPSPAATTTTTDCAQGLREIEQRAVGAVEPHQQPAGALDDHRVVVVAPARGSGPRAPRRTAARTPASRAAVSGASGSGRRTNSVTSQPASRRTSSTSPTSPGSTPVCTGLTTITVPEAPSGQRRRRDRLAHAGPGAGDDEDHRCASTTLDRTSVARAQASAGTPALVVIRSREMPSGTDGGRKQPTRTPCSRHSAWAAMATCGDAIGTESTAPAGASTPSCAARRRDAGADHARQLRARARSTRSAASAPPVAAGLSAVSKMNGRARLTRWWTQGGGAEDRAALGAERLGERGRDDHVRGGGEAESRTSPSPIAPATPSPWASSTISSASCAAQTSASSVSGAASPSTE